MNENDFFKTGDLPLAGVLYYHGYPVDAVERNRKNVRAEFIFKRDKQLDVVVQLHWSGQLAIEPKRYFSCLKELKSRLYND